MNNKISNVISTQNKYLKTEEDEEQISNASEIKEESMPKFNIKDNVTAPTP